MLSPQGKIESSCRVSLVGEDRYLLDVRAGYGEALYERLRRFKLRVKADLEALAGLSVLQVRGPATPSAAELSTLGPVLAVAEVGWSLWSGRDVLFEGELGGAERVTTVVGLGPGDEAAFEAARIEAGVPEMGLEITDRTIPQEAGELVADTVSFTKGCYTGQELVARVDARGANTPRRLYGVVISDAVQAARGDEIVVDGAVVGTVTSVAWSPGFTAHVALAAGKARNRRVRRGACHRCRRDRSGENLFATDGERVNP